MPGAVDFTAPHLGKGRKKDGLSNFLCERILSRFPEAVRAKPPSELNRPVSRERVCFSDVLNAASGVRDKAPFRRFC
ncbi:MAG: hypothetical protein DME99_02910 [Verrucomicrobia bacterium]|nr:MAG: hypothetical protein DME99_02910 [Verrucomicrobiota bacterium]